MDRIITVFKVCQLPMNTLCSVITDGGEKATASLIGTENVLWIWCCVHRLSLVFQESFSMFPQHIAERKALFLVMLRKIVNFCIVNFEKLSPYLKLPDGCKQVNKEEFVINFIRRKNFKKIVIHDGWDILMLYYL
jgi:hypothetical protein